MLATRTERIHPSTVLNLRSGAKESQTRGGGISTQEENTE